MNSKLTAKQENAILRSIIAKLPFVDHDKMKKGDAENAHLVLIDGYLYMSEDEWKMFSSIASTSP